MDRPLRNAAAGVGDGRHFQMEGLTTDELATIAASLRPAPETEGG